MARRRNQNPKPRKEGKWWVLYYWDDVFEDGKRDRKRKRKPLAPIETMGKKEAQKAASEFLRPMNQGFHGVGSAMSFRLFVEETYKPGVLAHLRKEYTGPI